jgi:outer membrane protein assembly factor BamB
VANAAVNSSPSVVNGIVYFGNDAGVVSAVVVNTGASQWAYATPSGAPIHSAPAIDPNGTVIVASSDGNLYWIGKTGSLMTSLSLGGTLTSPNVDNGQIFVDSSTGALYEVSDSTGTVTWTSRLSAASSSSPAFDAANDIVVAGDGSGAVTAFNATTGAQLWKAVTGGPVTAAPLILGGTVYVGSADANFYAINETTGAVTWKYALTGPIVAAASELSGSEIWIGDSNAMTYAFSPSGSLLYSLSLGQTSGAIVGIANVAGSTFFEMAGGLVAMIRVVNEAGNAWSYQTATTLSTSPAIVDGTVYIGAADGGLYAFTPQGANPLAKSRAPAISITDSNWVCSTP